MRILVTYAVQGEFTELKFPGLIGEEEGIPIGLSVAVANRRIIEYDSFLLGLS